MADDDSSELSSLSSLSPAPSDDESDIQLKPQNGILKFFHRVPKPKDASDSAREMSPPAPKREPSPPHEYVLADNPDIAFLVEFRRRFDQHLGRIPHFGPQELERDVVETVPGDRVENFLCTLLRILLNRKQDIKPGHYSRALEEAVKVHRQDWPLKWEGKSPLSGGATFESMTPVERLALLKQIVYWTLARAESIHLVCTDLTKKGHDRAPKDFMVEPIGSDSDKRRYFLVRGLDDSTFRIYRESNPAGFTRTWWSVAGTIEEVKALSEKLEKSDTGPKARTLSRELLKYIPEFEEAEEKRKKREYRRMRKEQFKRPEPGFSLYEGRTRGKRVKYTYSDDEDFLTDSTNRRSTRNTRNPTPNEPSGPVVTASGRQSRPPNRLTAETLSNGAPSAPASVQGDYPADSAADTDMNDASDIGTSGRPRRSAAVHHGLNGWATKKKRKDYISDDEDDEDESEPDFGDDEEDEHVPDESDDEDAEEFEDADLEADDEEIDDSPQSRIVKLRINVDKDGKDTAKPDPKSYKEGTTSASEPSNIASPSPSNRSSSERTPLEVTTGTPEHTGDVVNVAFKRPTPEPSPRPAVKDDAVPSPRPQPPLTPSGPQSASLALRGSPDKPQQATATPHPIDVGYRE